MKVDKTSHTADIVTTIRAFWFLHARETVFSDPVSLHLLPDYFCHSIKSPGVTLLLRLCTLFSKPAHAEVLGRARYVEEVLLEQLDNGVSQYVLVGAGMDSFAWRYPELADKVTVFELDHPATHREKQRRLQRQQLDSPLNLEYVAIDFEKESIADALKRSGFDVDKPAVFCWMGVTYYLDESLVFAALETMQQLSAQKSHIVFDYLVKPQELPWISRIFIFFMCRFVGLMGEPIKSSYNPQQFQQALLASGFQIEENLTGGQLKTRYFKGNADRLSPIAGMNIMHVSTYSTDKSAV